MAFGFGSVASLVKSVIPALGRLRPGADEASSRPAPAPIRSAAIGCLSAEAEAALAPLGLPPDGPLDHTSSLRAKLTADAAAANFVRWARALDLVGAYSRRSIYALYCEFSEVDHRPALRDTHFLEALSRTEGIRRERRRSAGGGAKALGPWHWIIEQAAKLEAPEATRSDIAMPDAPPPVSIWTEASEVVPQPAPQSQAAPAPARSPLSRLLFDDEHPFSPAKLREREKSARRARFNAAMSRKQRGALRRAA